MQFDIKSINDFWQEIQSRLETHGILTIACSKEHNKWDVYKDGRIGESLATTAVLKARFLRLLCENQGLGIILRSFTKRNYKDGIPIKEVRGYLAWLEDDKVLYKKFSQNEIFDACNTNAKTGEPMPPEIAVEYCDDK